MKKKIVLLTSLTIAIGGAALGINHLTKTISEVDAYSHVAKGSLPTTIDLSDNTPNQIRSYYSSLSSLTSDQLQGDNLLKNLKPILSNNQDYYSYDAESGKKNCIWLLYEIIDRDWQLCPAEDITDSSKSTYINGASYNSVTKELSGYSYGTTDPSIHALYYDRDYPNYMTAWFNHSPRTKEFVMEREHVWPKSHGFDDDTLETSGGARGDPMHLWAAEGYTNGVHSNNYYGYVDRTKKYTNCGDYNLTTYTVYSTTEYAHHNYSGTSLSLGSGTVFEPQDCDKGDIARACFYMAARYNNIGGGDSTIDANNPNLYLNDVINTSAGTSTASTPYNLGLLHDLLEWHHNDPVDEFEIHRNNLLYNNYTHNRNPFIDYPEWADFIWGTPESNMTYSDPTGYAQPASDTINGYNDSTPSGDPSITSVTISPSSLNLDLNGTKTGALTANVVATGGASTAVTWSVDPKDKGVTVVDGVVTAAYNATLGEYTVIAKSVYDNTKSGSATVTVSDSSQEGDTTTVNLFIQEYGTAHNWTNGTKYNSIPLDSHLTANAVGSSNTGKYYSTADPHDWRFYQNESASINLTLDDGYTLDSVTFTYNVQNSGVLLDSNSDTVTSGSAYALTGNSATFTVGNTGSATNGHVRFTNISVTYHQDGGSVPATLTSITLDTSGVQKSFTVDDSFDYSGLIVTAHYDDSPSKVVTPTSISSPNMTKIGKKTITVTYEDQSATYEINVNEESLSYSLTNNSPYINGVPYKMYFYNTNLSNNYYFIGSLDGNYGATSTEFDEGVDVFFEESGNKQNLYFYNENVKTYITHRTSDTKVYFDISTSSSTAFSYDNEKDYIYCTISSTNYSYGTYSDYTTFNLSKTSYTSNYFVKFIASDSDGARAFSDVLLKNLSCDATGKTAPSTTEWSRLNKVYNYLLEENQTVLLNSEKDEKGNVIKRAMARYDYVLEKYGTSSYTNFIERAISSSASINNVSYDKNSEIVFVLVSVVSAFVLASFCLIIKKRKHHS